MRRIPSVFAGAFCGTGLIAAGLWNLAWLEVNNSGKLMREMVGETRALGGWYLYYAGIADKLEGRQIPAPNPDYLVYPRREPVGVVASLELTAALLLEARAGARRRLHDRDQALRALAGGNTRARVSRRRGGILRGGGQCRHLAEARGRRPSRRPLRGDPGGSASLIASYVYALWAIGGNAM